MELKVTKWGKGLAVRLPANIIQQMQIKEGDRLSVNLNSQGQWVLAPIPTFNKAAFIKELEELQKTLPETASVIDTMRNQAS